LQLFGYGVSDNYLWGVFGSVAVEVAAAVKAAADNGGSCPPPYNKPFYLIMRAVLAALAGFIPIALDANSAITAFYLGAGAPVFIDKARSGLQSDNNGQTN
jgi:hypothetical protein